MADARHPSTEQVRVRTSGSHCRTSSDCSRTAAFTLQCPFQSAIPLTPSEDRLHCHNPPTDHRNRTGPCLVQGMRAIDSMRCFGDEFSSLLRANRRPSIDGRLTRRTNGWWTEMRISVTDIGCTFGRQTRAYAEYRIFSSLARFADVVYEADVSLTSRQAGRAARCVVALTVDDGGRMRVSARGRHVYDAINRAAVRIGEELRRHTDIPLSS